MQKKKSKTQNISFPSEHLPLFLWLVGQENISDTARKALYMYKATTEGEETPVSAEQRVEEKLDCILHRLDNMSFVSSDDGIKGSSQEVADMKKEFGIEL